MDAVVFATQALVSVDVSAARRGVREAISISWVSPGQMNPAEATALAGDLDAARRIVDDLCPPPALTARKES